MLEYLALALRIMGKIRRWIGVSLSFDATSHLHFNSNLLSFSMQPFILLIKTPRKHWRMSG